MSDRPSDDTLLFVVIYFAMVSLHDATRMKISLVTGLPALRYYLIYVYNGDRKASKIFKDRTLFPKVERIVDNREMFSRRGKEIEKNEASSRSSETRTRQTVFSRSVTLYVLIDARVMYASTAALTLDLVFVSILFCIFSLRN